MQALQQLSKQQLVLVVEDSDDDFAATQRALKKSGNMSNPLFRCRDGQDALDYLYRKGAYENDDSVARPGLILLDLNMPGIDGHTVLKRIKADDNLRDIPVVVLTTSDAKRDIDACYRDGANTYIQKPVDLDGFFKAIQRLKEYWFEIAILPAPPEQE